MASLDRNLRRDLENAVKKARRAAEAGARQAVEQLAVGHHEPWSALSPDQRKLRNRLRAHGRQLGDKLDEKKGTQSIDRLTGECAYEHWHRLLFARFLAENDLLVEPESGMALSLDECRELAREQSKDWLVLASDFAQRMLPQIFRAGDPVLEVALPPEKRQELEKILESLPREVFIADDSLGWVYQFWQADQKDAVNASEKKIGADELPAVTQLFTEDYMVLFLLHNTLGAWWAGKMLAERPDLARSAASEDELRAACTVQGIEWIYLRFVREGDTWRPAAGTFPGWPTAAKNLTVLDPCMGSGHFLAFALPMLVALRREEEKLSVAEAVDAVLRDNLFGLELDPRCTQIAAFNVGLTAWKLAGYRPLPALNLACAGLAINAPVAAWTALAAGDALAENAMKQLYELFRQAPTLGSLIDPTRVGGELFVANFDKIRRLLSSALASEQSENAELAVVAQGIAKAASILAAHYTLVVTNVPYLVKGKQRDDLRTFCEAYSPEGAADLATVFIQRCGALVGPGGTHATVSPQNWLYLKSYKAFRTRVLREHVVDHVARIGSGATSTASWDVLRALLVATRGTASPQHSVSGVDVSAASEEGRAAALRADVVLGATQRELRQGPDSIFAFQSGSGGSVLGEYASALQGISTGDSDRLVRAFWELSSLGSRWRWFQIQPPVAAPFVGRSKVADWESLSRGIPGAAVRGEAAWDKRGVAIAQMRTLPATLYGGTLFSNSTPVIVPKTPEHLAAIWAFCRSTDFNSEVRRVNSKMSVDNGYLKHVRFDLAHWKGIAEAQGLSKELTPSSNDPTQWLFDGAVAQAQSPLQVAVALLVGVSWPTQRDEAPSEFCGAPAPRFPELADADGIVCVPPVAGEGQAADRLLSVLSAAYGATWTAEKLRLLLDAAGAGASLEEYLREQFFLEHCKVFGDLPFVWQIWDGRQDGFAALVNYHKLAAPNGEGRRTLEKLIYRYLGDWLDRQRTDQKAGVEGADGRVAAAEHLKRELEKILEGEPPYDIFVRWKPLHQQPVGWEPDIDDGVRVNIRPFMTAKPLNARGKNACILRVAPKIKWDKDRGKEPLREKADYPWFWGWDESTQDFAGGKEFDGNRWNDLHYTRAAKLAARERAKGGKR